MPTITLEDLDDPVCIALADSIREHEDRRFFDSLPSLLAQVSRSQRLKLNRRKKQARARTGRR